MSAPAASQTSQPRSDGRTILLNFGSLSASAAISRLAGLATNAILARRVSAAGFGVTGIAQSVTQYFALLSDLGLGTVAVREGAQNPDKLQSVISSMLGLRLALSLIAIPLGLLTAQYLPYSEASRNLFRIYLFTLPIQALSVNWVFRSIQRMHLNTVLQIVAALVTFTLTVTLVRQPKDLVRVAGIAAFAAMVTAGLGMLLLRRQGYHAKPAFSIQESRYFLRQSLPLCATSVAITLYSQANNLILGAVRGDTEVGLYVAATRLSQVCYYPIWLYFAAMAPALMQMWALSPAKARSLLSTSVRVTAIVSIGCGLIAASSGQWALTRIFGKSFNGSGAAFELLVWTGVVIAIGHNWGELCIASRRNRLLIESTFLGAFVNLMVCAVTVSRMGIRGAALSNMLAEIAVHALLIASFGWHMGLSILREAWKPVLAGGGAYSVSMATRWCWPPVCAAATGFIYMALLIIMGSVTRSDVYRLRTLTLKTKVAPESLV